MPAGQCGNVRGVAARIACGVDCTDSAGGIPAIWQLANLRRGDRVIRGHYPCESPTTHPCTSKVPSLVLKPSVNEFFAPYLIGSALKNPCWSTHPTRPHSLHSSPRMTARSLDSCRCASTFRHLGKWIALLSKAPRRNGGVGRALHARAEDWLCSRGDQMLQVKTLAESHPSVAYAETRKFYDRIGYHPLEVFPTLWAAHLPVLLLVKVLNSVGFGSFRK